MLRMLRLLKNLLTDDGRSKYSVKVKDFPLPWIIERKTLRDLEASIIDGRLALNKVYSITADDLIGIMSRKSGCNGS